MMGLARSTFYEIPKHSADDTAIVEAMAAICDEFEHYGWRRVRAALRQQGLVVNHKKIRRLMREHDLQPKIRRRFTATTDSNHDQPIFPNLAAEFTPDGPNQLWLQTSPMSPSSAASSMLPSFSMPGHAAWWAMPSADP